MAKYTEISRGEMASFLEGQGFQLLSLPGTRELVWAKVYHRPAGTGWHKFSMRVYSSIEGGAAREVGADAIRVQMFWKDSDGQILSVGGDKRVHRVAGWRANLQSRIDKWADLLGPSCPKCGRPTKLREPSGKASWKPFWGCVGWRRDNPLCDGKIFIN